MQTTSNLARRIYALFLSLYPSGFRETFADEMHVVFAEASTEVQRRGTLALAGMVVREMRGLLAGALSEHWQALSSKEAAVSSTLEMNGATGTAQINLQSGSEPGSWRGALLAGLPHILMACLLIIPTMMEVYDLGTENEWVVLAFPIAIAVVFVFLIGVVLFFARRKGWPRWTASWYLYGIVLVTIPVLMLFQLINESTPQYIMEAMMFVMPVFLAVLLYEIARRDRLKEVLIALPVLTLFWYALLEFVPPEVDVFLLIWGWMLTVAVAVIIVRFDNWRLGVWSFLGLNLLVGLSASYAYVFRNNIPPGHGPAANFFEVIDYFAPQFLVLSTLVLGPLLVWMLREVGRRSGLKGINGFRLVFWGLLIVMIFSMGAFYLKIRDGAFEHRDAGISLFVVGAAIGGLASLYGALVLGKAALHNKTLTSGLTTVLLIGIPLALPWIFAFIIDIFGMGSWTVLPVEDFPINIVYIVGLVWVLLAAWMVTSRCWENVPS